MCGILTLIQSSDEATNPQEQLWDKLRHVNAARGPDAQDTSVTKVITKRNLSLELRLFASELRLRGEDPVVQPHRDENCVFCWNGEVFEGLELDATDNDGVNLFRKLKNVQDPDRDIPSIFAEIEGPYAMVFYHSKSRKLYFGRDPLGRRSLLIHRPTEALPVFILASVSAGQHDNLQLEELDTATLFCLALDTWNTINLDNPGSKIELIKIPRTPEPSAGSFVIPARVNDIFDDRPPLTDTLSVIPEELATTVDRLLLELNRSVSLRVRDIPYHHVTEGQARVAILFSGGIDSTMLAYLADRNLPQGESIDLLNVAFENPRKMQLKHGGKNGGKNKRVGPQAELHTNTVGLDPYAVPDRLTGLEEVEELRRLCPQRKWNFLEIDITFEEMTSSRPIVEALMYPCRTVMDLSLALALYFASRGVGHVRDLITAEKIPFKSSARVLLNGLGSDELLGGYGRHRTALSTGGWPAVIQELQLDIDRIPTRNLGRDDRVISSHGKEVRHPFLSMSVVNFLAGLPVKYKFDPRLPLGVGDKMLLRLAAKKVGLDLASERKKRAMQFGSHSARMESGDGERRGDIILSS